MQVKDFKNLLEKYNKGEASEVERRLVDSWYDSFEWNKKPVESLQASAGRDLIRQKIWQNIQARQGLPASDKNFFRIRAWGYAAASMAFIFLGIGLALYFSARNVSSNKPASHALAERISTNIQQQKRLTLPDGSLVELKPGSKVELLPGYGETSREVSLEGEAFFEIRQAANRPFRVRTRDISVQVLGTSFRISAYAEDRETRVDVESGKVRLSNALGKETLLLSAMESGRYDRRLDCFIPIRSLALEHADFVSLADAFYKVYGLKLKTNDPAVLREQYNISLKPDRPATEAVETICHILNKQYRKEANGDLTLY